MEVPLIDGHGLVALASSAMKMQTQTKVSRSIGISSLLMNEGIALSHAIASTVIAP
jgi:hypothetical protein